MSTNGTDDVVCSPSYTTSGIDGVVAGDQFRMPIVIVVITLAYKPSGVDGFTPACTEQAECQRLLSRGR